VQVQVLGLGKAGVAAAQLLHKQGYTVIAQDEMTSPSLQAIAQELRQSGISVELESHFDLKPNSSLIVVSPGIRWDHSSLTQARQQDKLTVIGEAELAWQNLKESSWVGITGTNGKTTTTALVAAMFQAAGYKAPACGNIGLPLCQVVLNSLETGSRPDWIIAELSSYQLEASETLANCSDLRPESLSIGIWTTLTPDHLERHYTLDNYARIKAQLMDRVHYRVLNGDDPYLYSLRNRWPNTLWTSCQDPAAPVYLDLTTQTIVIHEQPWVNLGNFSRRLPGQHNLHNGLMATTAAYCAGLDPETVAHALQTFAGVPHRLEVVQEKNGIRFINDSKATNYDAALVGLQAIDGPIILIAGGQAKKGDPSRWLDLIQQKVSQVFLIGEASSLFAQSLEQIHYTNYQCVETLDKAVSSAWEYAQALPPSSNETHVLFSPACASFDHYQNFEERGNHFRQCCQNLAS
jgi:UDP-N-acetylmuramoylalanine--D-glutamate ligase